MSCVFHACAFVYCCLVVTCWERADLLDLVCDVFVFVTFPCGVLGQVWYLIVSISDLYHFSYLNQTCRLSHYYHGIIHSDLIRTRQLYNHSFEVYKVNHFIVLALICPVAVEF